MTMVPPRYLFDWSVLNQFGRGQIGLIQFLQRVMPGCIFLLSRLTLRVDHVLFRTFDTRLYHSFHSSPPLIIKETVGLEAPYDYIRKVRAACSLPIDLET